MNIEEIIEEKSNNISEENKESFKNISNKLLSISTKKGISNDGILDMINTLEKIYKTK